MEGVRDGELLSKPGRACSECSDCIDGDGKVRPEVMDGSEETDEKADEGRDEVENGLMSCGLVSEALIMPVVAGEWGAVRGENALERGLYCKPACPPGPKPGDCPILLMVLSGGEAGMDDV